MTMGDRRSARRKAAAVCWKRCDGEVRFLLVRTRDRERWTFPKGGIGKHETAADAAAKEAKEESGAKGTVDPLLLAEYVPSEEEEDEPIKAFLLEIETQGKPRKKERAFRKPDCFTAQRAAEVLAEGRDGRYADEHRRVIEAALQRLGAE